jgi:eukaryotic-like serine/threonine-protein kinase
MAWRYDTDVWVLGPHHQAALRVTFNPSRDKAPLWSPDGKRILWLSNRGRKNGFYVKDLNSSELNESPSMPIGIDLSFASAPSDLSQDGRFLLYTDLQEGDALHLWVLPINGERRPYRLFPDVSADIEGQFSPDGHWVAYSSNQSGRWEIYVASLSGSGAQYQVSNDGGQQPRWRQDGKELFFLSRDRKLMGASVKTDSILQFNVPVTLFQTFSHEPITAEEFFTYDVSADGRRFIVNMNPEQASLRSVDIILNWTSTLDR